MFFTRPPQSSRFSARRRDLASSDIFGVMSSPARTAKQEAAQAIPVKNTASRFTVEEVENSTPRKSDLARQVCRKDTVGDIFGGGGGGCAARCDDARKGNDGNANEAYENKSANVAWGEGTKVTAAAVRLASGEPVVPSSSAAADVDRYSCATTVDSSEAAPALSTISAEDQQQQQPQQGSSVPPIAWGERPPSGSTPKRTHNPIFGEGEVDAGWSNTQRTARRMVPSYFDRPDPRPRRKGARPETDVNAAGVTTDARGKHADDFRPGHRVIPPPGRPAHDQGEARIPQVRPVPAVHQMRSAGDPILQRGSDRFSRPDSARSGIRVFAGHSTNDEQATTDPNAGIVARPTSARPRGPERNPIIGSSSDDVAETQRGIKIFTEKHELDHGDVIGHQLGGPDPNSGMEEVSGKVGDTELSPEERLDSLVQSRLESRRTYVLNRAKVQTSSDALKNFIYDNPSAVP